MKFYLITVCCLGLINIHVINAVICISKGQCGCMLDDGSSELDLSPMMQQYKTTPMYVGIDTTTGLNSISADLCREFSCGTNDAMICSTRPFGQPPQVVSNHLSSFDYDEETKVVTFIYTQNGAPQPATTRITMHCTQDSVSRLSDFDVQGTSSFTSTLSSRFACFKPIPTGGGSVLNGGLSNGTIICIVFAVTIMVYIAGGISVNRFVRKLEGPLIFPNYKFWIDFPGYVKDGFKFSCSKLRGKDYEDI